MFSNLATNGEFYSLLCAFIWAAAVIMFTRLGERVPPVVLNLFKGSAALVFLIPTMLVVGTAFVPPNLDWRDWAQLTLSGIIGISIADSLFLASLNRLGAGRSAIVDCLYSPLVILCGWLALSEPVGPKLLVAVGLMVAAIFVGTWAPGEDDEGFRSREVKIGVVLGVVAMTLMAIGIVIAKPVLNHADLMWATTVRVSGATVFLAVQTLVMKRYHSIARRTFTPGRHWILLVAAGFVGTYLAMIAWLAGMKYTSVSISSVLNQTSTLIVPVLAAFFLKERLTWRKIVAVLMGFVGAVMLNVNLPAVWSWITSRLGL